MLLDELYPERFCTYFEALGSQQFADKMARLPAFDVELGRRLVMDLPESEVLAACDFHGNIGERPVTLDAHARNEQGNAFANAEELRCTLLTLGEEYRQKFGVKFMVSAAGKTGAEMLDILRSRMNSDRAAEWTTARQMLWDIAKKRLSAEPLVTRGAALTQPGDGASDAACTSVSLQWPAGNDSVQTLSSSTNQQDSRIELGYLAMPVAACAVLEYFRDHGISADTRVNDLFDRIGCADRVGVASGLPSEWADALTIAHCVSHNGVRVARGAEVNAGISAVEVVFEPGTGFDFSEGGFVVVKTLIERHSKSSIDAVLRPLLNRFGLDAFEFASGSLVRATGSIASYQRFQYRLAEAYRLETGFADGTIGHSTGRRMLYGRDRDYHFMRSKHGVGMFVVEGHLNKFMAHFGGGCDVVTVAMHCFEGPDYGKGFTVACSAEEASAPSRLQATLQCATVAQRCLQLLNVSFVETDRVDREPVFDPDTATPHTVFKQLIFAAFSMTRAEAIIDKGPLDPLAPFNIMARGTVVGCTNDRFARAENMLSTHQARFDPDLFGRMGKVMDSWESVRHNPLPFDAAVVQVPAGSRARYVYLSTKYHNGNQAPEVCVEIADKNAGLTPELGLGAAERVRQQADAATPVASGWTALVPKRPMGPHSYVKLDLGALSQPFEYVRVRQFPDGGFTRIGLYDDSLPEAERSAFVSLAAAGTESIRHPDEIPQMRKPLSMPMPTPTPEDIQTRLNNFSPGQRVDVASAALGAVVVSATNQHYGAASNIVNPFPPLSLFDALESSRSRTAGSLVEVVVQLAWPAVVTSLLFDFTFLVNNSPVDMLVDGLPVGKKNVQDEKDSDAWVSLVPRSFIKYYAGGQWLQDVDSAGVALSHLRVRCYPCGGFNRLRAFAAFDAKAASKVPQPSK